MPRLTDIDWQIAITCPSAGFSPDYFDETYPSYGRSNMAGALLNCDLSSPSRITQGLGLATLTAGDETGAVTTLIKHVLDIPCLLNYTFAVGGAKLYKLSASAVTNDATYPHTIDKAVVTGEDGESVCFDGTYLYYFYNHSGPAGDFGRLTVATDAFDDDFGSTVPTGAAALVSAPHPSVIGLDGIVYFGNGRYVGRYDPVTNSLSADELDLQIGSECVDVRYDNNRVVAAFNFPNFSGSNNSVGFIVYWDGVAASWDDGSPNPHINGKIGAIYVKNGTVYVWYQKVGDTGYTFGYIQGNSIKPIRAYSGSLPNFGQVGEWNNHLIWISNGLVHAWGSKDELIPPILSQPIPGGYTTVGALSSPFDTPLIASTQATNYKLAKTSGYSTNAYYKSILFDADSSMIDEVVIDYYPTSANSRVDVKIEYNLGSSLTLAKPGQTGSITNTNDSGLRRKTFQPQLEVNSFRIFLDWSSGSAVNAQAIRKVTIKGHRLNRVY